MMQKSWALLSLTVMLIGVLESSAAAQECEAPSLMEEAAALIEVGKEPTRVEGLLEQAVVCAEGQLSYLANFLLACVEMRLGQVSDARVHIADAVRQARTEEEAARAGQLERILMEDVYPVTFVRPDGGQEMVAVKLRVARGLPSAEGVRAAFPRQIRDLSDYMDSVFQDMARAANETIAAAERAPLTVWLPRGTYVLQNRQTFEVTMPMQVPILEIRWSEHTAWGGMGVMGTVPMGVGRVVFVDQMRMGPELHYGYRITDYWLLSLEGGYYQAAIWKELDDQGGLQEDAIARAADGDYGARLEGDAFTVTAAVGIVRPVGVAGDVSLLPGVYLRTNWINGVIALSQVDSKLKTEPDNVGGNLYALNWYGLMAVPDLTGYYPLLSRGGLQGGVTVGFHMAIGWGGYSDVPPDSSAVAFSSDDRWMLTVGGKVGVVGRF